MKSKTYVLVGLGVVGGSFAKALHKTRQTGERILAIDLDVNTLQTAQEEGVIDAGETQNKTFLQQADVVIISLYPLQMRDFLVEYGDQIKDGAIVTDVVGIKGALIDQLADVIPPQVDFIYGHPMAGRENKGYAYSDDSVFHGANYILTPIDSNKPANIIFLTELIHRLGFKQITATSPKEHDQMIAHTSQLAHVIATALINSDLEERETNRFVGDSYRDLTRIANINESLWSELYLVNKEALLDELVRFEEAFDKIKEAIQAEDKLAIEEELNKGKVRRIELEQNDFKLNDKI